MSIDLSRPVSRTEAAWADLVEGMSKSWMWSAMAMQDIKMRYRGSLLGPFWLTISMVIMIAAMGVIYARMFNMEISRYLPFLTVGLVIWNFVSTVINEGCETFLSARNIITQVRMPYSVHAWRTVYRNLVVLAPIHGRRSGGADDLQRASRVDRALHRTGACHPYDQRHLGEHSSGHDQRALSRRAADHHELRDGEARPAPSNRGRVAAFC